MTVKELREYLLQFDQDLPVYDADWFLLTSCHTVKDFPLGDYANPNCEYLPEVLILSDDTNM